MFLKTLIFLFLVSCDTKSSRLKEKPVLIVNGQQLTLKQFSEKLSAVLAPYDALSVKSMDVLKLAKLRVENDFIHNSILINYSVKNNVRISEEDVEEKLTQLRASYPNDIAFRKALAEQRVSFDQWRESIKASMLATKVVKAITLSEYVPSEKDVLEYFKNNPQEFKAAAQIRLRQIVVNQETEAKKYFPL